MHVCMGKVTLWGMEFRVQGARCKVQGVGRRVQSAGSRWGSRRVSKAVGIHGIAEKHDCAHPTQYTKHSNASGRAGDRGNN